MRMSPLGMGGSAARANGQAIISRIKIGRRAERRRGARWGGRVAGMCVPCSRSWEVFSARTLSECGNSPQRIILLRNKFQSTKNKLGLNEVEVVVQLFLSKRRLQGVSP